MICKRLKAGWNGRPAAWRANLQIGCALRIGNAMRPLGRQRSRGDFDPAAAADVGIAALGDPESANFDYSCSLLTAREARVLRRGVREWKFISSHPCFRWLLLSTAAVACVGAMKLFVVGWNLPGRLMLAFGIGAGIPLLISILPVYTPSRGPIFRIVKWVAQILALLLAFGPGGLAIYWLVALCVCRLIWSEYIRRSIRHKLPVIQWPRHLYV